MSAMENKKINTDESLILELESLIDSPVVNDDLGDEIIEVAALNKEVKAEIIAEEKKSKIPQTKIQKFFSGLFFAFRYVLTTSLIFGVLLVSTNYSAYYNIAMSYINAEELAHQSRWLISSVEAANIKQKVKEEFVQQKVFVEEDQNAVKTKNSVDHLLNISEENGIGMDIEITPYQNRVIIPKIGKNIPLVEIQNRALEDKNDLNNIFMKELENGVIRYPGSAKPGQKWNSFIFGHSSNFPWIKWDYNDVFALLDNVEFDDEVIIYYNQKKYKYIIREKNVISPGQTGVLKRNNNKSEITLMTCWPIGTTLNRLIVTGELIEEL